MSYNGWSNRETWLVNLWYNPETRDDVEAAKDDLEEQYESLSPVMRDFCGISKVDWNELLEYMEDESESEGEE